MRSFLAGSTVFAALMAAQVLACAAMLICAKILLLVAPELAAESFLVWLPVGGAGIAAALLFLKWLLK